MNTLSLAILSGELIMLALLVNLIFVNYRLLLQIEKALRRLNESIARTLMVTSTRHLRAIDSAGPAKESGYHP